MQDIGIKSKGRRLLRLGIVGVLAVALAIAGAFLSGVVQASHNFSDVPTTAFYHSAVEWIVNRAITAGCAAGLYCPNDAVTRGSMAVFLRALGVALTPAVLRGEVFGGAQDPDPAPVICTTPDFAVTGYPRQAKSNAAVSLLAAGAMGYRIAMVVSTDGGATWSYTATLGGTSNFQRSSAGAVGEWAHASHTDGQMSLSVGTTYRFGVELGRVSGTADATDSRCDLEVEISNRNPSTSPLAPARQRGPSDTNR